MIVTDISMPILNGIDAVRQLRGEGDKTKVVMLTMHTDAQIAAEMFRRGVRPATSLNSLPATNSSQQFTLRFRG